MREQRWQDRAATPEVAFAAIAGKAAVAEARVAAIRHYARWLQASNPETGGELFELAELALDGLDDLRRLTAAIADIDRSDPSTSSFEERLGTLGEVLP